MLFIGSRVFIDSQYLICCESVLLGKRRKNSLLSLQDLFTRYIDFKNTLLFLLPGLDRKRLVYWNSKKAKSRVIDTEKLFDEEDSDHDEYLADEYCDEEQSGLTRHSHKLSVEDEFLMVMMKLRMELINLDLAERFCVAESTVNNIFITWINYLYMILGFLKVWPHRDIILKNSPQEFLEKYPNTIMIIDATELKIQVSSALQKHSESYSAYKSHTTFKSLIGVDPNGGVMFLSQLYGGSISDNEIVHRSGLLSVLKKKIHNGEISKKDAIMADKGFDIQDDLKMLELELNIPPFPKDKVGFQEEDVITTQTIARHRIILDED